MAKTNLNIIPNIKIMETNIYIYMQNKSANEILFS